MIKDRLAASANRLDGKRRPAIDQPIGDARLRAKGLAMQAAGRTPLAAATA